VWLRLCDLPLADRRQFKDVFPLVGSLFGTDPATLLHSVQRPREGRAVHCEAAAQSLLGRPARYGQRREQSELRDLDPGFLQFLVINPRHNSRSSPKALACARQVKERVHGGRFGRFSCHNICICIYWRSRQVRQDQF